MKIIDYQFGKEFGLHARPAGVLANTASGFKSNITVIKSDGNRASARGIFALLGLKIEGGNSIRVEVEGEDEEAACEAIKNLFNNNFQNS